MSEKRTLKAVGYSPRTTDIDGTWGRIMFLIILSSEENQ